MEVRAFYCKQSHQNREARQHIKARPSPNKSSDSSAWSKQQSFRVRTNMEVIRLKEVQRRFRSRHTNATAPWNRADIAEGLRHFR